MILLLFILSLKLLADDDGWWIYTYEDVSTLKAVFNYLAMIKTDSSYMNIINTVLIAGLTFTIIFKFLDIMAIPKYFLSVVGTMLIVFSVNTTVMVLNVKSYNSLNPKAENYAVIDNVPFIFAVLTSAFSNVGYHSALLIETLFTSIVNGQNTMEASFLKTGNLGAFKILDALDSIDALTINEDGKKFNKNMNEYLHYCIYSIAYALDSGLSTDIATRPDLFSFLDPINSPNQSIKNIANQKIIDSAGTISTCSQLYSRASNSLTVLKDSNVLYTKANSLLSKLTSNIDNAGSTVAKMMTNSNLGDAQADINNYIMMSGVRKAFENSWKNYGVGATSAQAGFGAGLAEANIQAQGKVKAKASSSMMPSIHSVLQAVMYVLFPLVLIVQLFAGGFAIFKNYILGLLWLELWIPAYSVLNYFTLKEAQTQALDKLISSTKDGGPEGYLTLANQNEIYNTIANQAAIAADFYIVGVPAIAGFILFASFQALSSITSGVMGSVSALSGNQTLNDERAKIAALDNINEQMKLNNPLYTGNIGTAQAMVAQEAQISQASKAAGAFLASGSTLSNFNNLSNANTFSSMQKTTKDIATQQTLNNGGSLTRGLDVSENLAIKDAVEGRGVSSAMSNNPNMQKMMEANSEFGITYDNINKNSKFDILGSNLENVAFQSGRKDAQTSLGEVKAINSQSNSELQNAAETSQITSVADQNAKKEHLEKNFGNLKSGAETIANVKEGSEIGGVKKQIGVAGGEDNLIDVNSTQAAGKIAEEQSKQEILNKNGGYLNNMSDKGTFDGAQTVGKNQAMNTIGTGAIIQDSEVKTITSAGASQGEINALESMRNAGLLDKDTSLYQKKVSDAGYFSAVDKDGNKITMYTDGKGNTLGYEKQTVDKDANGGQGAGVRSIHDANGKILAKVEDGARINNYQDKTDNSKTVDNTIENKAAAMAGLNVKLSNDLANAKDETEREQILAKFLEDTRAVDAVASPTDILKTIAKQLETENMPNVAENVVNFNDKVDNFIKNHVPGGESIVEFMKDVDRAASSIFKNESEKASIVKDFFTDEGKKLEIVKEFNDDLEESIFGKKEDSQTSKDGTQYNRDAPLPPNPK
ncbi:conjugal transfer protein TraG N-terminal domain-containing protein [Aliarcobacter butzleri]